MEENGGGGGDLEDVTRRVGQRSRAFNRSKVTEVKLILHWNFN